MEGVEFGRGSDRIKPDGFPILDLTIENLRRYPRIRIEIVGHTDTFGSYEDNVDLSRRRAEAVKRYFAKKGIEEDRMQTRGAGPNEPISTNETASGRALNRRIEIKILEQSLPLGESDDHVVAGLERLSQSLESWAARVSQGLRARSLVV